MLSSSIRRQYRQHDEYTSITDAINIEFEGKTTCKTSTAHITADVDVDHAVEKDEKDDNRLYQQREMAINAGLQTEDEVEDEELVEEDEEYEDEDEEIEEEVEENLNENKQKRPSLESEKILLRGRPKNK